MDLKVINTRRNNVIYTDGKKSYKKFNEGYSKNLVFLESFITTEVESAGVNVPTIEAVTFEDNKWVFTSEYFEGETLFQKIKNDPDNISEYFDKLVEVQIEICGFKCPKLPIQKQKLQDYIEIADVDEDMRIDLLEMLNHTPKHRKLCHGNFTPHNVICQEDGSYHIVDWNHASQGNASADVARTYLWMMMNMPEHAEMYVNKFCAATNTSTKYVKQWIPIIAAARLGKKNPGEEKLLNSLISVIEY